MNIKRPMPAPGAPPPLHSRLGSSSTRLATDAAGAAMVGSAVAFFLSRRPTFSLERHHAKFRA